MVAHVHGAGREAQIEHGRGAVGEIDVGTRRMAAADVERLAEGDFASINGVISHIDEGSLPVGVCLVVEVYPDGAKALEVLVPAAFEVVGVAGKQVGVADLVALVAENDEACEVGGGRRGGAEGVAERKVMHRWRAVGEMDRGCRDEVVLVRYFCGIARVGGSAGALFQPQAHLGGEIAKVAFEGKVSAKLLMAVRLGVTLQRVTTVAGQCVARVGSDAWDLIVAG